MKGYQLQIGLLMILGSLFGQQEMFKDKLFNKDFIFSPKVGEVVIKFRADGDRSLFEGIEKQHNLTIKTPGIEKLKFGVYQLPAGANVQGAIQMLSRASGIVGVLPVYIDQEGYERYLDPELFTIQFNENISAEEAIQLLGDWSLEVAIDHYHQGYFTVNLPESMGVFEAVRVFMARSEVKFTEPAYYGFNDANADDTYLSDSWHLRNRVQEPGYIYGHDINVFPAWTYTYGSPNVVIVIIDTGIDLGHPDLANNILPRNGEDWDFSSAGSSPTDVNGHGTAVAGIAAGIRNGIGVRGVAPGIKIMPLKINLTAGMNQNRADAIHYAIDNSILYDGMVISCSWKASGDLTALHSALRRADTFDVTTVFAAANADSDPVAYPARYPETIAVGAMPPCDEKRKSENSCDGESWGSNYGDDLDIAAGGVEIYTTDIQGGSGYNPNPFRPNDLANRDYTRYFNGTSAATPQVAAAAALLLSIDPELTDENIRQILTSTADKVGGYNYNWNSGKPGHSRQLGYGRLDAYNALMEVMPPPAPTGLIIVNAGADMENPDLQWNAVGNATSYKVYRRVNSGSWVYLWSPVSAYYVDEEALLDPFTSDLLEYRVTAVNSYGESGYSNIASDTGWLQKAVPDIPTTFAVSLNYPNPFNPSTIIDYALPEPSQVQLVIYDLAGRTVATLVSGIVDAGYGDAVWQGRDEAGRPVPTGVYIYRIIATGLDSGERFTQTRKMVLLK